MPDEIERIVSITIQGVEYWVTRVKGRETLAGLFHFDVDVVSQMVSDRPCLDDSVALTISIQGKSVSDRITLEERVINGVVAQSIMLPDDGSDGSTIKKCYRVRVVPAVSKATLGRHYRLWTLKTMDAILGELSALTFSKKADLPTTTFQHLHQFGESDYTLLERLCQQAGLSYHADDDGKLVVELASQTEAEEELPYVNEAVADTNFSLAGHAYVYSFAMRHRAGPRKATFGGWESVSTEGVQSGEATGSFSGGTTRLTPEPSDYPGIEAMGGNGLGFNTITDDGLATALGDRATVEMTAEMANALRFIGTSDSRGMRAGWVFTMTDHDIDELNTTYRVVEVEHHVKQDFSPGFGGIANAEYENSFECIVAAQTYAPPLKTPKPVPPSLLSAKVSNIADPDEAGRYQVTYNGYGSEELTTDWIRMVNFFSGNGFGANFPLQAADEVVIGFVDSDIDKPVITGTLFNQQDKVVDAITVSPDEVEKKPQDGSGSAGRPTYNFIKTEAGHLLGFDDDDGKEAISLRTQGKQELFMSDESGKEKIQLYDKDRQQFLDINVPDKKITLQTDSGETLIKSLTQQTQECEEWIVTTDADAMHTIGGNESIEVSGDRSIDTGGTESITANECAITATTTIEGDTEINGSSSVTITVGGNSVELTSSGVTITASGTLTVESGGVLNLKGAAVTLEGQAVTIKSSAPIMMQNMVMATSGGVTTSSMVIP